MLSGGLVAECPGDRQARRGNDSEQSNTGPSDHTGGADQRVPLDEAVAICPERTVDLIALNAALERLAEVDLRKSQVVEMRFFGGLSVEETAEVLKVSLDTVLRDWRLAKLWLLRELGGETPDET